MYFHKKAEFLAGTLSNIFVAELSTSYTHAKSFIGKGDFIVTAALGTWSHFNVAKLDGSEYSVKNWYIQGYDPINFVFGDYFFVNVAERQSSREKRWMVGLLSDTYRTVWLKTREEPSGLFVKELITNNTAKLYYTMYSSASEGYVLYKEEANLEFTVSNQVSTSVGIN